jgi:3',5'-cyclic-AMP phosphodiesterase
LDGLLIRTLAWLSVWLVHPGMELATVADSYAVFFRRHKNGIVEQIQVNDLEPAKRYFLHGRHFTTLARPAGRLLSTFVTVNDVHIGESKCGFDSKHPEFGPVFGNEPGKMPYAEMMSRNVVSEISRLNPDAVLVKGDLTDSGRAEEFKTFLEIWGKFSSKLYWVCGNHDVHLKRPAGALPTVRIDLPGAVLAMIDTSIEGQPGGRVTSAQITWLEDLCRHADRPVIVFGHHHIWNPDRKNSPDYFGINPEDSKKLIDLFRRYRCLVGYFAGHTHSNHVESVAGLPDVPFVECGALKEFPGAYNEYRIYENGLEQIMHRTTSQESLRWEEMTSRTELGHYERRHFGKLSDRCFSLTKWRDGSRAEP